MGLGARIVILVLLAAAPVFLIQIIHDSDLRAVREANIITTSETLSGLIAARQDRLIEGARFLLLGASQLQSVREKDGERCHQVLLALAAEAPELTAMAVLTPAGDRWCISLPGTGPLNLADRDYFQATLRSGAMQSSDYIVGRQTGLGSIAFTYPLKGPSGAIESVLFVAYRTSVFSRLLNEPPLPPEAVVMLVDRSGTVAARWPDPDNWVGKNLSSNDVVRLAINDRRGVTRGFAEWAGPGEYTFAFTPMQPPAHLTVVVGLPLTTALRESEMIFWGEVGWTTVIFALVALLAIIGAHFTVGRPLRMLHASLDALARDDFHPGGSRLVTGSKELRTFAKRFEAVAWQLEERQKKLREAVQQKELLLKEVNHRVKNSLQLVASLFGLQRASIKDPEARQQFDEAGRRINTVAQIHQRLYQDENVDRVSLDRFVHELCSELGSVMEGNGKVRLICEVSPCYLTTDKVIPAALIVNELITNAFKYSYPGDTGGVIRVDCRPEGNALILSVSDDGVPLPKDFDLAKSSGLGMKMIAALAKQLRAPLDVVQHPGSKSFVLRVPAEKGKL